MSSHVESLSNYLKVFAALLVLTAVTVGAAFINFGALNTPIAISIAVIKALLVISIFMHVKHSNYLVKVFLVTGFLWLLILFGLTLGDYYTRDLPDLSHQQTWITAKLPGLAGYDSEAVAQH